MGRSSCRLLAHRDILQCRSSLSANGGIAEVEGWVGPAASVANDPKRASGRDDGCMSRFAQPAKALEHDPDPDADLLAAIRRNQADLMVSSPCSNVGDTNQCALHREPQ